MPEPTAIAHALRYLLQLKAAVDTRTDERILACEHRRALKKGTTIELGPEIAAAFAKPGETWSGKLELCNACGEKAEALLNSAGGIKAGPTSH